MSVTGKIPMPLKGALDLKKSLACMLTMPLSARILFSPTSLYSTSPTSFATVNVQPTGPETCEVEIRTLAMPGSVMPEEGFKELDQVMGEDCSAVERLQQSVRSSAFSVGPMAKRWEEPIVKFQQSYCGFMGL